MTVPIHSRNGFKVACERIAPSPFYEEKTGSNGEQLPHFDGRPIILEKGPINGGVFIGATPQEAVVIDESHGLLEQIYVEFLVGFVKKFGKEVEFEYEVVPEVFQFAKEKITLYPDVMRHLYSSGTVHRDQKVSLDFFVLRGYGVERHQLLLAAYLIERLMNRGFLAGSLRLKRTIGMDSRVTESLQYISSKKKRFEFTPKSVRGEGLRHALDAAA